MCLAVLATIEGRWQRPNSLCLYCSCGTTVVPSAGRLSRCSGVVRWRIEGRPPRRSTVILVIAMLDLDNRSGSRFRRRAISCNSTDETGSRVLRITDPHQRILLAVRPLDHHRRVEDATQSRVGDLAVLVIFVDGKRYSTRSRSVLALWFTAAGIEVALKWLHQRQITRFSRTHAENAGARSCLCYR